MKGRVPQETMLSLRDVSFRYPQQQTSLIKGLNLSFSKGSFTALLAPSGCGKTTLLHMLAGYLLPHQGAVYEDHQPIRGPGRSRIPVFQEDALFPWLNAIENVTIATLFEQGKVEANKLKDRATSLLDAFGIPTEAQENYPKELSVGMKKRVEIARALFTSSPTLLADEPFASLDVDTKESLQQFILDIWRKEQLTIVFSTHDISEALFLASDIVILKGSSPTRVAATLSNPLQGQRVVTDGIARKHASLSTQIRGAMR